MHNNTYFLGTHRPFAAYQKRLLEPLLMWQSLLALLGDMLL
jgi:hypothetical protein